MILDSERFKCIRNCPLNFLSNFDPYMSGLAQSRSRILKHIKQCFYKQSKTT